MLAHVVMRHYDMHNPRRGGHWPSAVTTPNMERADANSQTPTGYEFASALCYRRTLQFFGKLQQNSSQFAGEFLKNCSEIFREFPKNCSEIFGEFLKIARKICRQFLNNVRTILRQFLKIARTIVRKFVRCICKFYCNFCAILVKSEFVCKLL